MKDDDFKAAATDATVSGHMDDIIRALRAAYKRGRRDSAMDSYNALHQAGCPHGCFGGCRCYEKRIHENTVLREEES